MEKQTRPPKFDCQAQTLLLGHTTWSQVLSPESLPPKARSLPPLSVLVLCSVSQAHTVGDKNQIQTEMGQSEKIHNVGLTKSRNNLLRHCQQGKSLGQDTYMHGILEFRNSD